MECVLSSSECRCWGLMLIINWAQLAHRHQVCDPAASTTPQLLSGVPLFLLPLPPHHFLFLTLSQALKGLLSLVFLSALVFFTRDLPSFSQFSWRLPIILVWTKKFLTAALPILCFAIAVILFVHTQGQREEPSQPVTRLESHKNCRWSQTLHPSLEQPSSVAKTKLGALRAPGGARGSVPWHAHVPPDLLGLYSCTSPFTVWLLLCAGFLLL